MKIHILSDLHLEFGPVELPGVSCDVVVLAGDVATKGNGLRWIRERYSGPMIYLCIGDG